MSLTTNSYSPQGLKRSFSDSYKYDTGKHLKRSNSDNGVYPEQHLQATTQKIKKSVRFDNDHPNLVKPVPTEMLKYEKQMIFYNYNNTRIFMGGEAPNDLWAGRVKMNSANNPRSSSFDLNTVIKMVLGDLDEIMKESGEPSGLISKYIQDKVNDGLLSLVNEEEIEEVKKAILLRLTPHMRQEEKDALVDEVFGNYEKDKIKDIVERMNVSIFLK